MGAIHRILPADKPGVVYWFHGNSGTGKTKIAIHYDIPNKIVLDADDMRGVWTGLGFSKKDRYTQNLRLARLAWVLMKEGFNVCVASICPYADLRREINKILTRVIWVYVNGPDTKKPSKEYPFEEGGWSDR